MKKQQRRKQQPTPTPAALPPIPTDTPEGIVAHTVDKMLREVCCDLDTDDADRIGELFGLPALFVRHAVFNDNYSDDERIAEYIAWRHSHGGREGGGVMSVNFSEQTRKELDEEIEARASKRTASEAALDSSLDARVTPMVKAMIARRLLTLLWQHGLLDDDMDYFTEQLHGVAREFGVPFVELFLAHMAPMSEPEVDRDDLTEWIAWCQQHAPERLARGTEAA